MAVVNQNSDQVALGVASPAEFVDVSEWAGRTRRAYFSLTQSGAGDATSIQSLVHLPAGRIRIMIKESYIANSAFGAARTLDVGYAAYTGKDGVAVAADPDALTDAVIDVSAAATNNLAAAAGADPTLFINSRDGVDIESVVAGGTIPDAATLYGCIVYMKD